MHKYDQLIQSLGTWGPYQKLVSFLIICSILNTPAYVVILPAMQQIPSFTVDENGNQIQITDEVSYCADRANWNREATFEAGFINWSTDLNLVCNRKLILSFTSTAFFLGAIVSSTSFSKFADRFGRKPIFLLLNFLSLLSLLSLFFLYSINQLILACFITGMQCLCMVQANIILKELVDKRYYGIMFGIANAAFPICGLLNLICIYAFGNWIYFQFIITVTSLFGNLMGFVYLVESPTWLYANNRIEKFRETILYIAKTNGTLEQSEPILKEIIAAKSKSKVNKEESGKHFAVKYSYFDLIKYGSIRGTTLKLVYMYIMSGFSFYGLLLNLSGFTGSIILDSVITYSGETLAEIVSGDISFSLGRKKTILISCCLSFGGSVLFWFTRENYFVFSIVTLFIGSIGVASAFNVLYIYTAEVYPTNIRSLSMTFLSLINRLTSSLIAVLLTQISHLTIPIIAVMSLIAIFVTMSLQETENNEVGDDLEEIKESKSLQLLDLSDSSKSIYLNAFYESN